MGWIARIFKGSEVDRARREVEEAREQAEQAARELERWSAALGAEDAAAKAAVAAHTARAAAAAAENDVAGFRTALEQYELARVACIRGRTELARAHPRGTALLLLADASAATDDIRDDEDRSALAAHLGTVQSEAGDVAGARATLERVTAPVDRVHVLRAIAVSRATPEALAEYRNELATLDVPDDLDTEPSDIVFGAVQELCRRVDLAGARALATSIEEPEVHAHALHVIAMAEAHTGRLAEARALAETITHPRFATATLGEIAIAQAWRGDSAGALRAAETIEDPGVRASALSGIACGLAEKGREDDALALAERIDDADARDDALAAIGDAWTARGDFEKAVAVLDDIQNAPLRAQRLMKVAAALQIAGRRAEADALLPRAFQGMSAASVPFQLARLLVMARMELGEIDAAEAVVASVQEESGRAELLGSIASGLLRRPPVDVAALEALLARHPGPLERLAILEHGAIAMLMSAAKPESAARDSAGASA